MADFCHFSDIFFGERETLFGTPSFGWQPFALSEPWLSFPTAMIAEYLGLYDRSFRQFPLEFVPCCHSSLPTQLNSCAESLVCICIMQSRCVRASTTNVESCILHTGVLKKKATFWMVTGGSCTQRHFC